ncbi:hypothetical protein [Moorena sp. SIO3H5]|nr:hypothetical protein [Moorena sp. SIO3H5]
MQSLLGETTAALHRFASILVHCSLFPVPCSRLLQEVYSIP